MRLWIYIEKIAASANTVDVGTKKNVQERPEPFCLEQMEKAGHLICWAAREVPRRRFRVPFLYWPFLKYLQYTFTAHFGVAFSGPPQHLYLVHFIISNKDLFLDSELSFLDLSLHQYHAVFVTSFRVSF